MSALEEAINALESATNSYEDALQEVKLARSKEVAAINVLNDAQKAFDAEVAKIKSRPARESHWASRELAVVNGRAA